jgi:hypothetical protein
MATSYRLVLILGGTLIAASFFWYGRHAGFEGRSALLVESAQNDGIAQTVAGFAQTRQFVERTTSSGRFQESVWKNRSAAEQKTAVMDNSDVTVVQKSSVIVLRFFDTSEEGALVGTSEGLETLVRMTRAYENAEGLSVRVLDEPFVEKSFHAAPWFAVEVALSALFASLILELLIRVILLGKAQVKRKTSAPRATPEHFVPERLDSFSFPEETFEPPELDEIPVYEPGEPAPFEKRSFPTPVAPQTGLQSVSMSMEDLPFKLETPESSAPASPQEEGAARVPEPKTSSLPEPSVVEYKRRLNELLQG